MRRLAAVLALTAACTTSAPELTPLERAAGAAALAGWREAGLPEPNLDQCQVQHFQVRAVSAERYARDCMSAPKASWGCLNWDYSAHFFRPWKWPVVVLSPNFPEGQSIVVHELMHAFIECSHLGATYWMGDGNHTDPRVWAAPGGDSSAQGRAQKMLTAP